MFAGLVPTNESSIPEHATAREPDDQNFYSKRLSTTVLTGFETCIFEKSACI